MLGGCDMDWRARRLLKVALASTTTVLAALVSPAQGQPHDASSSVQLVATPIHSERVSVPGTARSEFLAALERFARENGFAYAVHATTPNSTHFVAEMERADARIIASNAMDAVVFRIYYYNGAQPLI